MGFLQGAHNFLAFLKNNSTLLLDLSLKIDFYLNSFTICFNLLVHIIVVILLIRIVSSILEFKRIIIMP